MTWFNYHNIPKASRSGRGIPSPIQKRERLHQALGHLPWRVYPEKL